MFSQTRPQSEGGAVHEALLRPELRLLLVAARVRLDTNIVDQIRTLLQEPLEWDVVLALAKRHGVLPLLYQHLNAPDIKFAFVPDVITQRLHTMFLSNAQRNLHRTKVLVELLSLFQSQGIPVLSLKGPVLAQMLYGDITLRQFADLDLLVRSGDLRRINVMLRMENFKPAVPLSQREQNIHRRTSSEQGYHALDGSLRLEIHENLAPPNFPGRQTLEMVWDRLQTVTFQRTEVRVFAMEDLLLYLCGHGTKHVWERLEWVCGVAEIVRQGLIRDWPATLDRARELRLTRPLLIGLTLAQNLLDVQLPELIVSRLAADGHAKSLAKYAQDRIFTRNSDSDVVSEFVWYAIQVEERPIDKWRNYSFRMFTPTLGDLSYLPLPQSLEPLYTVVRPIRLVSQYGSGMIKRLMA